MARKFSDLSVELVRELLDYDKESGFLLWRQRSIHHFTGHRLCNSWNTRYAGSRAGNVTTNELGYPRRSISVLGIKLYEHKLIWFYVTGQWPSGEIDHLDRDATNNAWSNLRDVDRLDNVMNKSKRSDNTSGVTGLSFDKKKERWVARVMLNGKVKCHRYFLDRNDAIRKIKEVHAILGFSSGSSSKP